MASDAFRFYRRDDMDTWASQEPCGRDDHLRQLVDELPEAQQHLVSRIFFGGAYAADAAAEIGLEPRKARDELRKALDTLRAALHEDHAVGPLSAAFLARESDRAVPEPRDVGPAGQGA